MSIMIVHSKREMNKLIKEYGGFVYDKNGKMQRFPDLNYETVYLLERNFEEKEFIQMMDTYHNDYVIFSPNTIFLKEKFIDLKITPALYLTGGQHNITFKNGTKVHWWKERHYIYYTVIKELVPKRTPHYWFRYEE